MFGRQRLQQQVRRSDDCRQQIVEIMRDARGQAADCFHLLRGAQPLVSRPQALFGTFALGHVAIVDDERPKRGITQAIRDDHLEVTQRPFLVSHAQVGAHHLVGMPQHVAEHRFGRPALLRLHEIEDAPSRHLSSRIPKRRLE